MWSVTYRRSQAAVLPTGLEDPIDELAPAIADAAGDVGVAVDDREGTRGPWPLSSTYHWEVRPRPEDHEYVLIERQTVSVAWLALLGLSLPALWLALHTGAVLLSLLATVGLFACFTFLPLLYPSPLERLHRTREAARDYRTSTAAHHLLLAVAGGLAFLNVAITGLPIASPLDPSLDAPMLGLFLAAIAMGLLATLLEDADTRVVSLPFDVLSGGPLSRLGAGYCVLLAMAAIPLLAVTESRFLLAVTHHFWSPLAPLYFELPLFLLGLAVLGVLGWSLCHDRDYAYALTLRSLEIERPRHHRLVSLSLAVGASWGLAFVLLGFVDRFESYLVSPVLNGNLLPLFEHRVLLALLLILALPALFFAVGLCYQTGSSLLTTARLFVRSTPIGCTRATHSQVRRLDEPALTACSLDLGVASYVFVSAGTLETFTPAELEAIVAHEEGHVAGGDARFAAVIPLLSLLALTGKNVLYSLVHFRGREFAADAYAADRGHRAGLESALERVATRDLAAAGLEVPSVHAWGVPTSDSRLVALFGLFYGGLALQRAHPEPRERLERLRE